MCAADGSTFNLELLLFPGLVKPEHAAVALRALHDSVMWTYLSTGPEATLHAREREEVYALVAERDSLKCELFGPLVRLASAPATTDVSLEFPEKVSRLSEIRARLALLMTSWTDTGYFA